MSNSQFVSTHVSLLYCSYQGVVAVVVAAAAAAPSVPVNF